MRSLKRRLDALDRAANPPAFKPWHRIILDEGQSEEDGIAAYEAEHGPLGEDSCFFIRFISPEPRHA
ncbi:hypothetical protein [Pelagerythrobacter aerophilus]|uniref:Uncharacterized protein n=1 Tax=Pelagerythrobacter aerophilus TaxID=2306995 RepID=A0A418NE72_9SPHN|nr:hypothetical protein [Pelagerythrobacter aerophilus]RIV75626.1 hypothetical protein D2V04_15145 [Pelagerythrobacter aerophilus]